MKPCRISSPALPRFPPSMVLLLSIWIFVFVAGLQIQRATAEDNFHYKSPEDQLEEILANEKDFEFDEGLEDDNEEAGHLTDDGFLTKDELQDLQEAKESFYMYPSTKARLNATINGTTTVTLGNTYLLYSHENFSRVLYPNNFFRYFNFVLGPSVAGLQINCSYFRIQRSFQCFKDRVVIYSPPPTRIIRLCGGHPGLNVTYFNNVYLAFITNPSIRKPGFCCEITPIPMNTTSTSTTTTTATTTTTTTRTLTCCDIIPTAPPVKRVVRSCADLLPGYSYCQCTNTSNGGICLICSFCQTCNLQFFAVHDFSQTKLYIYFSFPCTNCTMNLATYSFGYQQYVKGYVNCLNPATHITLPTYPVADYIVAVFCPLQSGFDICAYFQSLISGSGRRLSVENGHQKDTAHLAKSCNGFRHLTILEESFDSSIIHDPETYRAITITGDSCVNFNQGGSIDLVAFTNVQIINLYLCHSSLSCGSIILNSSCIQQVTVRLPNAPSCNSSCIVSNQAATPPPNVVCP